MVHATPRPPIAPASAWCDDCGDPNPVVFRQAHGDVHSMCAGCWGTEVATTLLGRKLVDPVRTAARAIAVPA